ncbi:MAG: Hsp20 family protein [Ignavibacteriales bacterium]|nr:Hsp20 family protein [Ignavibacteriales bacterium]
MALVKWNPSKELLNFEREINRFRNSIGRGVRKEDDADNGYENAVWAPLTDISENEENYVLNMDLPGVKKDDVKISYANGELSVSGERKFERDENKEKYHRVERAYGKYYRSFTLPKEIKVEEIKADFTDGSLTVTIPKADEAKPKEIEIKVG